MPAASSEQTAGSVAGTVPREASQYFLGFMVYQRLWFHHDMFGVTLGGGAINNPGRYLVLLPPINGATAITGSPYFPENPGDSIQGVGRIGDFRLHAKPIHYLALRIQPSRVERPIFQARVASLLPAATTDRPPRSSSCPAGVRIFPDARTSLLSLCL